ncbi:hypothetical protein [Nocardia brasiliensis]
MAKVLVTTANLRCGAAPPHQPLTMSSSAILTVRGARVLLASDYRNATLDCKVPVEAGGPCKQLLSFTAGLSTVLKVNGTAVVLATAAAPTDASAANGGKFTVVDPGQAILDAK